MSEKDTTTAVAPRFYTLQELADLGVGSESTLRKAIKEGRLSFHHITHIAYITQGNNACPPLLTSARIGSQSYIASLLCEPLGRGKATVPLG